MSFAVEMNKLASSVVEKAFQEEQAKRHREAELKWQRIENEKAEIRSIFLPKLKERIKARATEGKRHFVDVPHYQQPVPESEYLTAYLAVVPQWLRNEGFGVGKISYHTSIKDSYVYTTEISITW